MKYSQVVLHSGGRGNAPFFVYLLAVSIGFTVFVGHHQQKGSTRSYHGHKISQIEVFTTVPTPTDETSTTTVEALSDKQMARHRKMENNLKNPKSWTSLLASMGDDVEDEYRMLGINFK